MSIKDRIDGDKIYINADGVFPKQVILLKKDDSGESKPNGTWIMRKTKKKKGSVNLIV